MCEAAREIRRAMWVWDVGVCCRRHIRRHGDQHSFMHSQVGARACGMKRAPRSRRYSITLNTVEVTVVAMGTIRSIMHSVPT